MPRSAIIGTRIACFFSILFTSYIKILIKSFIFCIHSAKIPKKIKASP